MHNQQQAIHKKPGPKAQRGFSLWELAVLLGLLGLGIVAGFVFLKAGENSQRETGRSNLLAAADRAIMGFVAEQGRLPCPDTDGTGVENCTGLTQKGWLPTITLGLDASAPARGVKLLRYVAYRNATLDPDLDLATLTDRFSPSRWDNYSSTPSANLFTFTTPQLSVLDFCQGLNLAMAATPSSSNAHVLDAAGGTLNVAYALADGGQDRDGDGNAFDGALNLLAATPGLESPARAADSAYDDRVLARGFSELQGHFDCPQATRSLDAMAQAVEVVNEVIAQTANNKDAATMLMIVESLKAALAAVGVAVAVLAMAAAVASMTAAAAFLALNTGLCAAIITAPVGCPLVAVGVTAVAAAGVAIGGAVVAIAGSAVGVGLEITAAVKAGIAAGKAGGVPPGGTAPSLEDMVTLLLDGYNAAVIQADADLTAANAARTAADAALTAYNNSVTALFTAAHVHDTTGSNDAALTSALNLYKTYKTALDAYYTAAGDVERLQTLADAATTTKTDTAAAAAAAAAITPSTAANIIATTKATLDAAVVAETNAKTALAAAPTITYLINAATNATIDVINASIDFDLATRTAAAVAPVRNYVQTKQYQADQAEQDSTAANAALTAAQGVAGTRNTAQTNAWNTFDSGAITAASSSVYDWKICDKFLAHMSGGNCVYIIAGGDAWTYHDGFQAIRDAIRAAGTAYDDWFGLEQKAVNLKLVSDASDQNVKKAWASYVSLLDAATSLTGTAPAITATSGADAILQHADLIGAIK